MLNNLGGQSCLREMSKFAHNTYEFASLASDLYGGGIGGSMRASFMDQNWIILAYSLGLVGELPFDDLNPFGDFYLYTCGDEAGKHDKGM